MHASGTIRTIAKACLMPSGILCPVYIFIAAFLVILQPATAQDRCSIIRYEEMLLQRQPGRESRDRFERWMSDQLTRPGPKIMATSATIVIPVVVHVIHNGETTGSGTNVSDAQILSQLDVINKDFNRLNNDASQTPADFTPLAGSLSVEFVLARRDPNGQQSTGIVRVNGGKAQWGINEENEFKSRSYWPAEDYLNMWVLDLSGTDIGYSSFPISNLPGLEGIADNRLLDGVVVDYRAFGSKDYGNFNLDPKFNTGRTATHEIGHFFGLRHIWGDGNSCNATDYVADTPPQIGETTGCPAHPQIECSSQAKMFQNYMDYTDDRCMNLFTVKQAERMMVVIANSPRRTSLTTSLGGISPNFTLEAALRVVSPAAEHCPGSLIPVANILNLGSTVITKATIELLVNGTSTGTYTFNINLAKDEQTDLNFPEVIMTPGDVTLFRFILKHVNDLTDEYPANNTSQISSRTSLVTGIPFTENMDAFPAGWQTVNPDGSYTWTYSEVRAGSLTIPAYDYDDSGAQDFLYTPVFDASSVTRMLLQFDMAYARYPGNSDESLSVYLVEDCNTTLTGATLLYTKKGAELATAPDDNSAFVPTAAQWRTETVVLNGYTGRSNLRLAFVFKNAFGNNIYLDRVRVLTGELTDLRLVEITEPSIAVCSTPVKPKLKLVNAGTITLTGARVNISRSKALLPPQDITFNLAPGEEAVVALGTINLVEGPNGFSIEVVPAGTDINPSDNSLEWTVTLIARTERVPFRERFEGVPQWSLTPEGNAKTWEFVKTNRGTSAAYRSYTNSNPGERGWLVSPALDFSRVSAASLFGDFSYAERTGSMERVQLLASTDCGTTFPVVLFDGDADALTGNISSISSWAPTADADWSKRFFDLSALVGKKNVLVAMVVTNDNGNNFFADNLEFFAGDDPEPVSIDRIFQIYTEATTREERITFNLDQRQSVRVQIFTSTGMPVLDNTYDDVLNQTVVYQLNRPSGIYIYR
ncbi:MAG: M43 family zinc metalloprotease, partial [Bacteroidota bacterium]